MSVGHDRTLDRFRFCALPKGFYVYPSRQADGVIFRCEANGLVLDLTPVEALILAARLAFVARERLAGSALQSPGERRFSVIGPAPRPTDTERSA